MAQLNPAGPGERSGAAGLIGVGTDLVEVEDIRRALGRRPGMRERLFTELEWEYSNRHRDPMPHLAGRFAAKEAVMKSLGVGITAVSFTDIEISNDASGRPSVVLSGRAAEVALRVGASRFEVSLTHTTTMAHAMVAAL